MLYCPRCGREIVEGQRFCKNCGIKVGVILDAIADRQHSPFDIESLKRDLKELGNSLRAGFEEATSIKRTRKLEGAGVAPAQGANPVQMPNWTREFNKALNKVKAAHSRKYSFQLATLSILGGGAWMLVWSRLLSVAEESGLFRSIEAIIFQQTGAQVYGLSEFLGMIWLLGAIPVARGVAHLINGIFIAPRRIEQEVEQINPAPGNIPAPANIYVSPVGNTSNIELAKEEVAKPEPSVTEDETLRFSPR
jgi:zinc-ribbon domain